MQSFVNMAVKYAINSGPVCRLAKRAAHLDLFVQSDFYFSVHNNKWVRILVQIIVILQYQFKTIQKTKNLQKNNIVENGFSYQHVKNVNYDSQ